ncbi:MAG: ABC transporter permease [Flavobacteriales bacterium]|jgi:ABC-type lipoprotein release transport system permease subunit|nr:ABC transporter permease [Flavobacteriales bacterium]
MYLKLAWRNLWRNKARTFITMAAVLLAVLLSTLMMSMKEGVYVGMIDSMVGAYTGYGQVHTKGYWDEPIIDNCFEFTEDLAQKLKNESEVKGYTPRIEGFALSSSEDQTKGAMVLGIDTELELAHSQLNQQVIEGAYLEQNDKGILLGKGLAKSLHLTVGDTIVLIGQGYHGSTAAGKYPIRGIVRFGSPELSNQLAILEAKQAQLFFGLENQFTSLILHFYENEAAAKVTSNLAEKLGSEYEVMDWTALSPDLVSMIETDRVEGYVFMFILYMVISFGIFGTVLMMLSERKHEFGVLVSIGMKRIRLAIVVWIEILTINLMGAILGMLAAFPIAYFFYKNPIKLGEDVQEMMEDYGMEAVIQTSVDPSIFISQATIVLIIGSVIAIYPFINITRLNVIKAMRS